MPGALIAALLLSTAVSRPPAGIYLAGERVVVSDLAPVRFTPRQIANTSAATRAGLARYAATDEGRRLMRYFAANGCVVDVYEDAEEAAVGIAPQPGMATLLDHSPTKVFELILNPRALPLPSGMKTLARQPATADELMAAAWAAEMLHIYFYAQGISLPHHRRADFQQAWATIASQLGFPGLAHGEDDDAPRRAARGR